MLNVVPYHGSAPPHFSFSFARTGIGPTEDDANVSTATDSVYENSHATDMVHGRSSVSKLPPSSGYTDIISPLLARVNTRMIQLDGDEKLPMDAEAVKRRSVTLRIKPPTVGSAHLVPPITVGLDLIVGSDDADADAAAAVEGYDGAYCFADADADEVWNLDTEQIPLPYGAPAPRTPPPQPHQQVFLNAPVGSTATPRSLTAGGVVAGAGGVTPADARQGAVVRPRGPLFRRPDSSHMKDWVPDQSAAWSSDEEV
jgi:hypothetical protein